MSGFSISLQPTPARQTPPGVAVRVETVGYVLRNIVAADVTPQFAAWFDDPLMLQGLNLDALHFSVDGLRAFVASFNNIDNFLIGAFARDCGQLKGFYNFSVNRSHRVATLTLGMEPHSGQGRAILWETAGPLFDEMFAKADIDKIAGRVLVINRRILFALMDNDHFVCEGVLRQECMGRDGKRLDVMAVACFKDLGLRPKKSQPSRHG